MITTRRLVFLTALGACGRFSFDPTDGAAGEDAAAPCAGALAYNSVGDGSPSSPYLLCTAAQWIDLAAHPESWTAHFKLAANIDLSAIPPPHPAIGTYVPAVPFAGVMDGDRHVIRNFTNPTGGQYFGLFGYVSGAQAEIKNIALVDAQLWTGQESGGLVGYLEQGRVQNAAIVGANCYVRSMAYANHRGTLIGETRPGSMVVDVFGSCFLDGGGGGVGGLIGHHEGSVANCYYTYPGLITDSYGNYFGGLVGWNTGPGSVSNCFAITDVHGKDDNGGTVGLLDGAGTAPVNSYYASNRSCINDRGACSSFGTGVDLVSTPDYFFHKTNAPLSSWDFSTVWMERASAEPILTWLPTF